ncbi:molecular chaperone [Enterobacter cloacae]|uniref:fimbrial biogenesis chaperone n=1 Tax=Enterobacter cloacae TaxID=550 RepID=UPI000B8DB9C5|nr:molecular chaperone [Enterobacter cloacae]ASQ15704.1 Chaperone protein FocC [Enterobacter cloacae]
MSYKITKCIFIMFVGLCAAFGANATYKKGGISLDVTRVVFTSDNESVAFRVNNSSKEDVWLLKSWVSQFENYNDKSVPFFITPPLIRINEDEKRQFRINKLDDASLLPSDRESIFHINVMAIPPVENKKTAAGHIELTIMHQIKLLYRPASIEDRKEIESLNKKIQISKTNNGVKLKNPTPYYASMGRLALNNKNVTDESFQMIAPFSEINIPSKAPVKTVDFNLINDFGGMTRSVSVVF